MIKLHPRAGGWLTTDLVVAMGLLAVSALPLSYTFVAEARLCRAAYYRAVALEVVDGEMEFLAAGEYKSYPPGVHQYEHNSPAARQLPGKLELSITDKSVRLEWKPAARRQGSPVVRQFELP
jgi:hypothetical protein